jgi:DNA-binding NtrC family response regulator
MKPNILVVDDEYSVTFSLTSILTMHGYDAVSATTAKKAIDLIRNNNFDVAFFDIKMPEMNGVELLKEVKKFNTSVIVIMMTAYADNKLIQEALKENAFICLIKPFEISEVLELLKKLIKK